MKHQVLFSLKNNEKIFMKVVCCSRDWRIGRYIDSHSPEIPPEKQKETSREKKWVYDKVNIKVKGMQLDHFSFPPFNRGNSLREEFAPLGANSSL